MEAPNRIPFDQGETGGGAGSGSITPFAGGRVRGRMPESMVDLIWHCIYLSRGARMAPLGGAGALPLLQGIVAWHRWKTAAWGWARR